MKEIITNCEKVRPAADTIAKEGDVVGKNAWELVVADAERAVRRAQDVLDTNYDQR